MAGPPDAFRLSPSIADRLEKLSVNGPFCGGPPGDYFVDDAYENPVAWVKRNSVRTSQLSKDVLFDNLDMRNVTLDQYGHDKPEYIKWKLFGYNIVITYEYISKGKTDEALKVIGDIENILSSIGSNDPFLKSIFTALQHITLSTKGHVLKLCTLESEFLKPFAMPNEMNQVNKAGLYGVQTVFFYEYALPCAQIAKDCALKAISLNKYEAEWHYLLARVLTHWQRSIGNFYECSKQEFDAAEKAVKLGKNDVYKLHLVHIYQRMSKNSCVTTQVEMKNKILDQGLQLLNEVIKNSTNDLLLLKSCLLSLSKFSFDKPNDSSIDEVLENLINKLKSSNNGYVHGAIGNHYLFNKKDFKMANFHLKKAYEAKSFGSSIDYIYTLYRIDPDTTLVEPLLVDMLKSFPHPVQQEKILSQIVSYLMLTKNDLIQALRYVPILLSLKHVSCMYNLQVHKMKFSCRSSKPFNLIDLLWEKLNAALKDSELSVGHAKKVTEVLQMLESYNQFVSCVMKENEHIFGNDFKKDVPAKNNKPFSKNDSKELWRYKNPKENTIRVKSNDEGNWRSLKPDSTVNPNIFSRGYHRQISNSGVEIKSRLNFK